MSTLLTARAFGELIYLEMIGLRGFRAVKRCVSRTKRNARRPAASTATIEPVVDALETASAFYPKIPPCLQRSAVVTRMLRRRGVDAEMVIGCHLPPLKAHAWVEVGGKVVSDYQTGIEYYRVLDRW